MMWQNHQKAHVALAWINSLIHRWREMVVLVYSTVVDQTDDSIDLIWRFTQTKAYSEWSDQDVVRTWKHEKKDI